MIDWKIYNLIWDKEFRKLVPPLSRHEYKQLEHEIVYNNYREPVKVWRKKIIGGFEAYEIYHRNKIPFYIQEEAELSSKADIIHNIMLHSIQQNNISDERLRYCIGKFYHAMKASMADKNWGRNQYTANSGTDDKTKYSTVQYTAELLPDRYKFSPFTIYKFGTYAAAIDTISEKNLDLAMKLLSGNFYLSQENTVFISKLSLHEINTIHRHLSKNNTERISLSEILKTDSLNKSTPKQKKEARRIKGEIQPEIKQMPKYDPDAEISSLSLTIPAWVSSLNRFLNIADFKASSPEAIARLENRLTNLSQTIQTIHTTIKENSHE